MVGDKKKTIVLSGINLFEAGPLSIFYDCLDALVGAGVCNNHHVVAFVHRAELFSKYIGLIKIIELPKSRNNYIYRLYYEFIQFNRYSKKNNVDIWISLHDITPRVKAKKLYTYCHNPTPFMPKDLSKIKYSIKIVLFSLFYRYLYRININKTDAVIVQQDWIREEFRHIYPVNEVIVARPTVKIKSLSGQCVNESDGKTHFLYAAYPRFFKNFEIICQACKYLDNDQYDVWLTIDGSENRYSSDIRKRYSSIKQIKWLGIQKREDLFQLYNEATCLIFPSTLETWGLPISEFKTTGKDIILIDLPYAHEALGTYEKVQYFKNRDAKGLAECMKAVIDGKPEYQPQKDRIPSDPFASHWNALICMIIGD